MQDLNQNIYTWGGHQCKNIEETVQAITRNKLLNACNKKVDNTGNVKIWPSEEYLANHLIKNSYLYEHKSVCELGAGKSGLAAIALAIKLKVKIGHIMISDGNEEWCEGIKKNLQLNADAIGSDNVARVVIKHIVWDEEFQSDHKYDYIFMADWLFFRDYHEALQNTLAELLQDSDDEGRVLIVGPNRSNTVNEFVSTINEAQMFDHNIDPIDDLIATIEDDSDKAKLNLIVESENDIVLNEENKNLLPNMNDIERDPNPLCLDDLDGEDEDGEGDINDDPLGLFA